MLTDRRIPKVFYAFLTIVLMVFVFLFVYFEDEGFEHAEINSDVRENSTDYFLNNANASLTALECGGQEYRKNKKDKEICFDCGRKNACFSYAVVQRNGSVMNKGATKYLKGDYSIREKYSFQTSGITEIFNCRFENQENKCDKGVRIERYTDNISWDIYYALLDDKNPESFVEEIEKSEGKNCEKVHTQNYTKYECGNIVFEYLNSSPRRVRLGSGS